MYTTKELKNIVLLLYTVYLEEVNYRTILLLHSNTGNLPYF